MHNLIQRLLEKRGIKDVTELEPEERADFERWQQTFNESEITLDKVVEFCQRQMKLIESGFKDTTKSDAEKARMTLLHSVYGAIMNLISGPKAERESLVKYLEGLLS